MQPPDVAQYAARHAVVAQAQRRKRRRKGKVRPLRFPNGVELEYRRELRRIVAELEGVVRAELPALQREVERAMLFRSGRRTDDAADVQEVLARIAAQFASVATAERIAKIAVRLGARLNNKHVIGFAKQLDDLGVNVLGALGREPWLEDQLVAYSRSNVQLVKGLAGDLANRVEGTTWRAITGGARVETLSKDLGETFGYGRKRADLIARDQVGKLQGQLNEVRQVDAGVTQYEWDTSQDERVRPGHEALHGTTQSWAKPPITSTTKKGKVSRAHPGGDVQCRCSAIPKIPDEDIE